MEKEILHWDGKSKETWRKPLEKPSLVLSCPGVGVDLYSKGQERKCQMCPRSMVRLYFPTCFVPMGMNKSSPHLWDLYCVFSQIQSTATCGYVGFTFYGCHCIKNFYQTCNSLSYAVRIKDRMICKSVWILAYKIAFYRIASNYDKYKTYGCKKGYTLVSFYIKLQYCHCQHFGFG